MVNFCSVFLVDPVSVSAIDGTTVIFSCTVRGTDTVTFRVNDTSATLDSVFKKGFQQLSDAEDLGNMTVRRNMTVTVSSLYNNTEIICRAQGTPMNADSQVAVLTVQGTILFIVYEVRLLIYQIS